jgi:hypothetical protein
MKITINKDGSTTYEITVEEYKVLFGGDTPKIPAIDAESVKQAIKDFEKGLVPCQPLNLPYSPATIAYRGCETCYACNGQPWLGVNPPTCTCNPICKVIADNKIMCLDGGR